MTRRSFRVPFERNGRHCNAGLYSPWILTNRPGVHLVDCYRRKITRDMNVTREIRCESRFINIVSRTWFQWNYIRVSKSVPCIWWVMVKSVFRVRCYALILMIDDSQALETNFHRRIFLQRPIPFSLDVNFKSTSEENGERNLTFNCIFNLLRYRSLRHHWYDYLSRINNFRLNVEVSILFDRINFKPSYH